MRVAPRPPLVSKCKIDQEDTVNPNEPQEMDGLGKTIYLDGFVRNKRGKSVDNSPQICHKCGRIVKGESCIFCGHHFSIR